ncbi:FUSC family protein [uncultured Caulobacter sp.]|uniref:FUSC family protein n=1 Tax=uncultured Caulobacter sp. TaxID=158749 RepID=UPI002624D1FB|nr:FUSC family protein [uncultured Caulobacter sp.]
MAEPTPGDWRRFTGVALPRTALKAAAARQTEIRHAIRVSAAVGAAFALATLLRPPQGYWAVFTAVIVVQSSLGATITASVERFMGTVVGALAGAAAAYFHARWPDFGGVILCVTVALLSFVVSMRPALKVAPVTAVIMLIGGTSTHFDPLTTAWFRVAEITVGSVVGVAATLLIFPARAHASVVASVQKIANLEAQVLDNHVAILRGTAGPVDNLKAQDELRAALARLQGAMTEADRESASKLSDRSISEAVPRTLWRLRNDTVMVGRTLQAPLPAPGLAPAAADMLEASAAFLRASAALLADGPRPDRLAFASAHQAFQGAVEALRREGVTRDLEFDDAARVFGLVFAVENLFGNLGDFEERIEEAVAKKD